jgi:hypothetical protein
MPDPALSQLAWAHLKAVEPTPAGASLHFHGSLYPQRRGVERSGGSSRSKARGRRFKSCPRYQSSCGKFWIDMNDRRGDRVRVNEQFWGKLFCEQIL